MNMAQKQSFCQISRNNSHCGLLRMSCCFVSELIYIWQHIRPTRYPPKRSSNIPSVRKASTRLTKTSPRPGSSTTTYIMATTSLLFTAAERARIADLTSHKLPDSAGACCHLELCGQLDFLPFRCPSCKHTFCTEHRLQAAHSCPNASAPTSAPSTPSTPCTPKPKSTCAKSRCKKPAQHPLTGGCSWCSHLFCDRHRMPEDHSCPHLDTMKKEARARNAAQLEAGRSRAACSYFVGEGDKDSSSPYWGSQGYGDNQDYLR